MVPSTDPERERRAISNEVLAFQLTTLQEAQTAQSALLREQIREGFADQRAILNQHTVDIGDLKISMARIDARTTALEAFRSDTERRREEDVRRVEGEQRHGETEVAQLRFYKWVGGGLVALLGVAISVLTILTFFGGH
jgi:hypothetical protein